MRHARPDDLAAIAPLLERLRALSELTEKSPGAFYRGAKAFLHFHEHEGALLADVKIGDDWRRLPASKAADQRALERLARTIIRAAG